MQTGDVRWKPSFLFSILNSAYRHVAPVVGFPLKFARLRMRILFLMSMTSAHSLIQCYRGISPVNVKEVFGFANRAPKLQVVEVLRMTPLGREVVSGRTSGSSPRTREL